MKFKLLHFVFFFVFMHSFAQYKPIDTADYAQRKEFLNQLKTKNEALIKSLKSRWQSCPYGSGFPCFGQFPADVHGFSAFSLV